LFLFLDLDETKKEMTEYNGDERRQGYVEIQMDIAVIKNEISHIKQLVKSHNNCVKKDEYSRVVNIQTWVFGVLFVMEGWVLLRLYQV